MSKRSRKSNRSAKTSVKSTDTYVNDLSEGVRLQKPIRYLSNVRDTSLLSMMGLSTYYHDKLVNNLLQDNLSYHTDRYREYELMERDTLICSALELYSDDATAISSYNNRLVRVQSKDITLQKDIEALLDRLEIDERLWNWAYQLALYGDHYIHVSYPEGSYDPKLYDYDDPACILDIWELGSRRFYIEDRSVHESSTKAFTSTVDGLVTFQPQVYEPNDFIHLMITKSNNFTNVSLQISEETNHKGDYAIRDYQVLRGSSMIEGVRYIYRLIRLLEDSLLAVRVNQSQYVRVFNIEVKDAQPKKVTSIINEVKNLFDSKASFNINTSTYSSSKQSRPYMDPIFNPVRDGIGQLNIEEIGGNIDVAAIADIDYFNNKLFGGLKIPKAYLGWDESISGGIGNESLLHLDLRYSRSVTRIIKALKSGVSDIIDLWLSRLGRSGSIGNYEIEMNLPNNSEKLASVQSLSEIFSSISSIVDTVSSTMGEYVNMPKVLQSLLKVYLPEPELLDLLDNDLAKAINRYEQDIITNSVLTEMAGSEDDDTMLDSF